MSHVIVSLAQAFPVRHSGKTLLTIPAWRVERGQVWGVVGPSGAGKSLLAAVLAGQLELDASLPWPPFSSALVSFSQHQRALEDESRHDDSDFLEGGFDAGTLARHFLADVSPRPSLLTRYGVDAFLDRGIKFLSTGEFCKLLIVRALASGADLLIFDEPYEGLDATSRERLAADIDALAAAGAQSVFFLTQNPQLVPPATEHLAVLENCAFVHLGPRSSFADSTPHEAHNLDFGAIDELGGEGGDVETLVNLKHIRVGYDERMILDRFSMKIERGQHTLIRGPNGCGKSTILNLINGDHPQAWANDVSVCGFKRGDGSSIWELKKRIGQVSERFHIDYLRANSGSVLEVLLSGFYDSMGLFRVPGEYEEFASRRWLDLVGIRSFAQRQFASLSWGEQRTVLVLRALLKKPPLLVLDEACQGLDREHRDRIMAILDHVVVEAQSTIIYVTHDPQENLAGTRQIVEFLPDEGWKTTLVDFPDSRVLPMIEK